MGYNIWKDFSHFVFNIFDLFVVILYLFGALMLGLRLARREMFFFRLWIGICVVHILATVYFVIWSLTNSSDAYRYYSFSLIRMTYVKWGEMFGPSTDFINFLTYPLPTYLGLSFWGATFVYSFLALLAYYILIKISHKLQDRYKIMPVNRNLYYFLLLPILHFYTCPIGKDSLIFLSLTLVVYGLIFNKYGYVIIFLAVTGFIRPHIFLLFTVGAGAAIIFFNKRIAVPAKIVIIAIGALGAYLLLPILIHKIGLDDTDVTVTSIGETVDRFETYNQDGGSSVDMSNSSLPVKMFSYLFRPLFFDAHSALQLIASFENIVWLFLVFPIVFKIRYLWKQKSIWGVSSMLLLSALVMLIGLSMVLSNLGLAMRQRTMLFPMVFLLYFLVKGRYEIQRNYE